MSRSVEAVGFRLFHSVLSALILPQQRNQQFNTSASQRKEKRADAPKRMAKKVSVHNFCSQLICRAVRDVFEQIPGRAVQCLAY
jgi:hypothetical protein